jgi:hypothetical protein
VRGMVLDSWLSDSGDGSAGGDVRGFIFDSKSGDGSSWLLAAMAVLNGGSGIVRQLIKAAVAAAAALVRVDNGCFSVVELCRGVVVHVGWIWWQKKAMVLSYMLWPLRNQNF